MAHTFPELGGTFFESDTPPLFYLRGEETIPGWEADTSKDNKGQRVAAALSRVIEPQIEAVPEAGAIAENEAETPTDDITL